MALPISNELPVIPLTIQIVQSPQTIGTLEDLKFQLKVANDSGETITLVRDPSGILSSRYRTEKFVIGTPDGRKAPPLFKGIKVKWSPERAAELGDTIVIGPGKTTHNIIDQDLSRTYDFTAPGAGTYTFTPKNFFYIVDPVSREVRLVRAASVPAVSVRISGKLVIVDAGEPAQAQEPVTKFQDIEFVGGTPEQHVRIADVVQHAEQYIDNCNSYLEAMSTATLHYETWFGAYVESLKMTVTSVYSNIEGGPMRARYDLTTCTDESSYAYVVSDDPTRTIYLCPMFWKAPLVGINSQAGTIVHELTHFKDYGNTWDWAYGVVNCKALAIAARHLTVQNADSYEYFAEVMGSNTASGVFFSNEDGFNGTFAIPENSFPSIFMGKFNIPPPPFNTSNVMLIYGDKQDLTGTYAIQAGSIVRRDKIDLRLKNGAGTEMFIFANLTPNLDADHQVMGNGSWN
ncbi:hypothetical protein AX14_009243 [Amanita brunnescens Koide BX004]|nr:hypothetical protein AX14_009243 [Amanita brunnescens Koide BX004]